MPCENQTILKCQWQQKITCNNCRGPLLAHSAMQSVSASYLQVYQDFENEFAGWGWQEDEYGEDEGWRGWAGYLPV